jgi:hypothetical protein
MKALALAIALCALPQAASAETAACGKIPSAKERLACYDKKTPAPNVQEGKTAKKTEAKDAMTDPNKFLDEEDARMKKALKPICQHC